MTRDEFKKLEKEEIERIEKACPNYKDDSSIDALNANARLAYFYSCIIDKLFVEKEELQKELQNIRNDKND